MANIIKHLHNNIMQQIGIRRFQYQTAQIRERPKTNTEKTKN